MVKEWSSNNEPRHGSEVSWIVLDCTCITYEIFTLDDRLI